MMPFGEAPSGENAWRQMWNSIERTRKEKKTASFRDCTWNQLQLKLPASDFVAREGKSQDIIRYDGSPSSVKCPWIRIPWFT